MSRRDARRVLFGDANVDVLVGMSLRETVRAARFADVRVDDEDVFIFVAEKNHFFAEAVACCLFFHAVHSSQNLGTRD